jgi:hypothetical protein
MAEGGSQRNAHRNRVFRAMNRPLTVLGAERRLFVEPNGESSKPSGKPLLFTYLRLTPNHP